MGNMGSTSAEGPMIRRSRSLDAICNRAGLGDEAWCSADKEAGVLSGSGNGMRRTGLIQCHAIRRL